MILWLIAVPVVLLLGGAAGFLLGRFAVMARLAASEAARTTEAAAAAVQKELLLKQLEEQKIAGEKQLREQYALQQESAEKQKNLYLKQLEDQKNQYAEQRLLLEKQMQEQAALQRENAQKEYEKLKEEFKVLAEKILAEKSQDFEKNGKTQLDILLSPLKVKLDEFKANAETARKQTLETNAKLSEQINLLMKSSREIGDEANQLAKALRSDNKMLGNWGEMILDEILSSSGLSENVHYHKQLTLKDDAGNALRNDESGKFMRPDVLINYPDGKVVVVDSKVSLNSYIDWVNCDDENERKSAAEKHLKSVKAHMDGLAKKDYSAYICQEKQEAVEFVIMFMPNAGAYELAMRSDINLWREGFEKKVLLVSPVNLMALLQLIHVGWKRYEQERNQQKILEDAGMLLDRLYSFYDEFDKVGELIEKANSGFRNAADLLRGTNGRRGVVSKGEELKKLGVKMKKRLAVPKRFQADDFDRDASEVIEISAGSGDIPAGVE